MKDKEIVAKLVKNTAGPIMDASQDKPTTLQELHKVLVQLSYGTAGYKEYYQKVTPYFDKFSDDELVNLVTQFQYIRKVPDEALAVQPDPEVEGGVTFYNRNDVLQTLMDNVLEMDEE